MRHGIHVTLIGSLVLAASLVTGGYSTVGGQAPKEARPARPRVSVGRNVQISLKNSARMHYEIFAAANPDDPRHLLACSMLHDSEHDAKWSILYSSFDAGATWTPTLEVQHTSYVGDPACEYALNGSAIFSVLALHYESDAPHEMLVYRSGDAGRTWSRPVSLPFIDREFIAVDRTSGPYRGRIYIEGAGIQNRDGDKPAADAVTLFVSKDGGATFGDPVRVPVPEGRQLSGMGWAGVLSDGTLAFVSQELYRDKMTSTEGPHASMMLYTSRDGGATLEKPTPIAEQHRCRTVTTNIVSSFAVDRSAGPFRDRLYASFTDARNGRCQIVVTASADRGKTWSPVQVISDDGVRDPNATAPNHTMPSIAVNKDGVVGVVWYDRREDKSFGWMPRFRASLDGGETWLPSVPVSEAPYVHDDNERYSIHASVQGGGNPRPGARKGGALKVSISPDFGGYFQAGDTGGMAAGADGTFHPIWVDNRTGVPQIWTAAVSVEGKAVRHGATDLAVLDDVTNDVYLSFARTAYDVQTHTVTLNLHVKNTSSRALSAPLKLRVTSLSSPAGVPVLIGADNGEAGAGAVFDLSPLVQGGTLAPGATTGARRLTVRLDEFSFLQPGRRGGWAQLINLEARAYGRASTNGEVPAK